MSVDLSDTNDSITGLAYAGITAGFGLATMDMIGNMTQNTMGKKKGKKKKMNNDMMGDPFDMGGKSKKGKKDDMDMFNWDF